MSHVLLSLKKAEGVVGVKSGTVAQNNHSEF